MNKMILLTLVVLCFAAFDSEQASASQDKNPPSEGSWLINQLTEGDARLKEQLKEGDSNIKELLREGDANLKELLMEGVTRLKEQQEEDTGRMKELVNEEYGRLKRRLVEDVERLKKDLEEGVAKLREERKEGDDWLRDQITRAETHLTEELTRELTQAKKQLKEQHEAIEDFRKFMTDMAKRNQAAMEQLTEKMTTLTEKLQTYDTKKSAVEGRLQSREDEVSGQLQSLRTQVETARGGLDSQQVTATHTGHTAAQQSQLSSVANATGSTFVRWGRTSCPENAVLVYSGVAGGGHNTHPGTGANRLCLTLQPQFDNTTLPGVRDWLYGAEYDGIPGHENWDVPCALCRAPQPTTIMVPATLTCPPGWALQYTGHLAGHYHASAASTEFVCLDAHFEHRPGSANSEAADGFYYTRSTCAALPCPPYVDGKVVTCVVCSL